MATKDITNIKALEELLKTDKRTVKILTTSKGQKIRAINTGNKKTQLTTVDGRITRTVIVKGKLPKAIGAGDVWDAITGGVGDLLDRLARGQNCTPREEIDEEEETIMEPGKTKSTKKKKTIKTVECQPSRPT